MFRALIPTVILSSFPHLCVAALSEPAELAKQELHTAVKAEEASRTKPGKPGGKSSQAYLRDLEGKLEIGDRQQIDYSLTQITDSYTGPAVAKAADKLRAQLTQDADKREADELAGIETLKKEVAAAIPKASQPGDLDTVIEKMVELLSSTSDHRTEKVTEAIQTLLPLKLFTSGWQDYLQARENRDLDKADNILTYLTRGDEPIPIPRSAVIALIGKKPPGEELHAPTPPPPQETPPPSPPRRKGPEDITELDELGPALVQLREMRGRSVDHDAVLNHDSIQALAAALTPVEATYQEFKSGLPVDLNFMSQRMDTRDPASASPVVSTMRAKLLLLILPGELGIPQEEAPKPGETVMAFLDRVEKDAGKRGDDETCLRVMDVRLTLDPNSAESGMERSALRLFKAGRAQESAQLPIVALVSYRTALQAGPGIPLASLIGKRLEGIKRSHPKEYDKTFNPSPPAPRE